MEELTEDEFKAMCRWFHENGVDGIDFETSWRIFVQQATEQATL